MPDRTDISSQSEVATLRESVDSLTDTPECQEALNTLYSFLDGELTEVRRATIQRHLDECSTCLEAFDFEAELKIVVAQRCREVVPDALRGKIAQALHEASASSGPDRLGT